MKEWQKRVVEERQELYERIVKLEIFLRNKASEKIPVEEQDRLSRQRRIMREYGQILTERIDNFTGEENND